MLNSMGGAAFVGTTQGGSSSNLWGGCYQLASFGSLRLVEPDGRFLEDLFGVFLKMSSLFA